MARVSPVAHDELIRRPRKFGFTGPVAGGKHLYMTRGQHRLTIPNRHRREIGMALLVRILEQAGNQAARLDGNIGDRLQGTTEASQRCFCVR